MTEGNQGKALSYQFKMPIGQEWGRFLRGGVPFTDGGKGQDMAKATPGPGYPAPTLSHCGLSKFTTPRLRHGWDLRSLEEFAAEYLRYCDSSIPTVNTLFGLTEDYQNTMSAGEKAYIDLRKELAGLPGVYEEISARLDRKFRTSWRHPGNSPKTASS